MPTVPQPTSVTISQVFDIVTGATLEEAGQSMVESFKKYVEDGHHVVSISHAFGPVEGEDKWSIMVLYRRES